MFVPLEKHKSKFGFSHQVFVLIWQGEAGVKRVLNILKDEFRRTMMLTGNTYFILLWDIQISEISLRFDSFGDDLIATQVWLLQKN